MQSVTTLTESDITRIVERVVERALAARSEPSHYTVDEAAQRLRCSVRQAYRLIALGQLRSRKIAGRTSIDRAEIERYLAEAP